MTDLAEVDLRCGDVCWRCRRAECSGRYHLPACEVEYDGLDAMAEAFLLLKARYEPKPERPAPTEHELLAGDRLVPWDPQLDRRPRTSTGPRLGRVDLHTAAQHGECTRCFKDHDPMEPAVWRWVNRHGSTRSSLCDRHGQLLVTWAHDVANPPPPIEVPEFTTAEEALAWLDAQTPA